MSWYKTIKVSSVTFELGGSSKISQPKTLMDISYNLNDYITKKDPSLLLEQNPYDTVSPDGGDVDSYTGIINYYFDANKTDITSLSTAINEWINDISLMDIVVIHNGKIDQSKLFKGLSVFRLQVKSNDTQNIQKIPKINLSNDNAQKILSILGQSGFNGVMGLSNVKVVLDKVLNVPFDQFELMMGKYTRMGIDSHNVQIPQDATPDEVKELTRQQIENRKSGRMIDGGFDINDLHNRLMQLKQIIDYGVNNNFKELVWY